MEKDFKNSLRFTLEVEENLPSSHVVTDRQGGHVEPMSQEEFASLFGSGSLLAVGNIYQTTYPVDGGGQKRACIILHVGCTVYRICL